MDVLNVLRLLEKYPNKVPCIIQRHLRCNDVPQLKRKKYLLPKHIHMSDLLYYIRAQLTVPPHISVYVLVGNSLPSLNQTLSLIYEEEKAEDGYLYISYSSEHAFG